jgi:hypothetical protein
MSTWLVVPVCNTVLAGYQIHRSVLHNPTYLNLIHGCTYNPRVRLLKVKQQENKEGGSVLDLSESRDIRLDRMLYIFDLKMLSIQTKSHTAQKVMGTAVLRQCRDACMTRHGPLASTWVLVRSTDHDAQ